MEFCGAAISEKQRVFYRIWTRKEAVLKWSGRGISDMEESLSQGMPFKGYLQELVPAAGFIGFLAIHKQPSGIKLGQWI